MIKILFFIPDLSGGGAEKVLCNLVNNMDQTKFDITVHTVNRYDSEKYLSNGIRYRSIINCKSKVGKKIMMYWYRFCTEFKLTYPLYIKDDYDIEVAYLECGATKVIAASTNKKAVKLAWVHCNVNEKGLKDYKIAEYYSKYDKVVCVSEDTKQSFDEQFGDVVSSTCIYNVIDDKEILYKAKQKLDIEWEEEKIHLLTVGRLSYEKGCDRLIEAFNLLIKRGYNVCVHLLGEGPERTKLEKIAKNYHLEGKVIFEGFSANPYPFINKADLIVIPSRTEALSTVAIESLILGKVVVTTPCSGMQELFGESEYGLIVEDTIEGLYRGLEMLVKDSDLIEHYTKMADKRKEKFKVKKTVEKTEVFLTSMLCCKRN